MIALGGMAVTLSLVIAQAPATTSGTAGAPPATSAKAAPPQASGPGPELEAKPNEHPLTPILRWASRGLRDIEKLKDYSALLVKRERINGTVGATEYMTLKVRHKPFSVYAHFLAPSAVKGQELIFVEGRNNGKFWVHRPPWGTMRFDPRGERAMSGQRYPLTDIGLANLVRRLVEVAQKDLQYGECEVKYYPKAKINNRTCTMVQVVHPVGRPHFRFYLARVFVDDQRNLPVRYESWDWPREAGGKPELIEEYTYVDLALNNGFTDDDFSITNPQYRFPVVKSVKPD